MAEFFEAGLITALVSLATAGATYIRSKTRRADPEFEDQELGLDSIEEPQRAPGDSFEVTLRATRTVSTFLDVHKADHAAVMVVGPAESLHSGESYTSVLYEDLGTGLYPSVMDSWQRMPLDPTYREILIETFEDGSAKRVPDDLARGSALGNAWRVYEVERVEWFALAEIPGARYFIALSFHLTNETKPSGRDTIDQTSSLSELRQAVLRALE